MKKQWAWWVVGIVSGCGQNLVQPDGGRNLVNCNLTPAALPITVKDTEQKPVDGAQVIAKNLGTGNTKTATTGADGRVSFSSADLGEGSIEISVSKAGRQTQVQGAFVCGDCVCVPQPLSIDATLP